MFWTRAQGNCFAMSCKPMNAGLNRQWGPEHPLPLFLMRERAEKKQGFQAGCKPAAIEAGLHIRLEGVPCNREEEPYPRDPNRHIYACSPAGPSACPPPMPHTFWDTGHHACIVGQDGILRATQRVPRSTGTGGLVYERVGRVTSPPDPEGTPANLPPQVTSGFSRTAPGCACTRRPNWTVPRNRGSPPGRPPVASSPCAAR